MINFHPVLVCPVCAAIVAEWCVFGVPDGTYYISSGNNRLPNYETVTAWRDPKDGCYSTKASDFSLCGRCGADIDVRRAERVARWISTSTWWKPWTWRTGFWQFREEFQRALTGPKGEEGDLTLLEGGRKR